MDSSPAIIEQEHFFCPKTRSQTKASRCLACCSDPEFRERAIVAAERISPNCRQEPCIWEDLHPPKSNIPEAQGIFNSGQFNNLAEKFVGACEKSDINFIPRRMPKVGYLSSFKDKPNLITLGVKLKKEWYNKNAPDLNVLFLENALLNQEAGIFIDSEGLYCESSLTIERHYQQPAGPQEIEKIQKISDQLYGDEKGYNPDGPIMFAMQVSSDAPVKHHYQSGCSRCNPFKIALSKCAKHLPPRPVMVRPHPKDTVIFEKNIALYEAQFRNDWFIDSTSNAYDKLRQCSALVTINSTLATEALILGMPVATLGRGAFTGSGATMEIDGDHRPLNDLLDFKPSTDLIEKYLAAVIRHQISYECTVDDILNNLSFQRWAKRAN